MKTCLTEVFSRVTGFFRPVQDWNKGKQGEFGERKQFDKNIRRATDELGKRIDKATDGCEGEPQNSDEGSS